MLFSLFGCATTSQKEKISVSWFDADGSLIATEVIDADTSPSIGTYLPTPTSGIIPAGAFQNPATSQSALPQDKQKHR